VSQAVQGGQAGPATGGSAAGACAACLRRGALVGRLAPAIGRLLLSRRSRPRGLLQLGDSELIDAVVGGDRRRIDAWLEAYDDRRARRELGRAGLDCVCLHSDLYPRRLLYLSDPPAVLYVAGEPGRLATLAAAPCVTMVGSRAATPYALAVARDIGAGLARAGVTVVSGLALGVDAAAHRGALAPIGLERRAEHTGGSPAPVVGVLAARADRPSPQANRSLYEEVRSRGTVASELPPGTPPARWTFPARNRIMAALGATCVVVEAQAASGSLITAGFASDLGRDVRAVPGRVTSPKAAGSNGLLRDGAGVVRSAEDVLDDLCAVGMPPLPRRVGPVEDPVGLDASAERVLQAVSEGCGAEGIAASTGMPPAEVRGALGLLELHGLVRRDHLGAYERVTGRS
jgi:DNA processing protein